MERVILLKLLNDPVCIKGVGCTNRVRGEEVLVICFQLEFDMRLSNECGQVKIIELIPLSKFTSSIFNRSGVNLFVVIEKLDIWVLFSKPVMILLEISIFNIESQES